MAKEHDDEEYYEEEDDDEDEDEEVEYSGLMALLHDEEKEPHVHLGILLIVTFIVAVIVKIAGI